MSSNALASSLQMAVTEGTAFVVLFILLTGGLVGMSIRNMFESVLSEEEEAEGDGEDLGGDSLGGDLGGGGDDLGGGGGDFDDDLDAGGGDLGGLDDDVDDLGGFDDGGGAMGGAGGGANTDELEHRLDELENEMGNLSSTVNTVRTENEQIAESVDEVEENVRKLLDIYEMVTRGVNPFADDVDAGMGMGGDEDSFGLFADEDGGDSDGMDDSVTDQEAEGFFDEDLVEEEDMSPDSGGDVDDVFSEPEQTPGGGEFEDSFDDGFEEDEDFDGEDDSGGDESGTSFEELKDEYESGEADWADEVESGDDETTEDDIEDEHFADAMEEVDESLEEDLDDDELFDEVLEPDAETDEQADEEPMAETGEPDGESADEAEDATSEDQTSEDPDGISEESASVSPEESGAQVEETTTTTTSADTTGEGKPYLATLPEGFGSELIVVEWLEFLVEEAGVRETASAISYYETIDWISEDVAEELQSYLQGFDGKPNGSLTIDHHTQSLEYISQLNGGGIGMGRLHGGGSDGIQR